MYNTPNMTDVRKSAIARLRESGRTLVRELGLLGDVHGSLGLTNSQVHALIELEQDSSLSVIEIAQRLCLEKSSASRLVDSLVDQHWAATKKDFQDGRRRMVTLTTAGREILAMVHSQANKRVAAALSKLNRKQQQQAVRGLALYADALRRSAQGGKKQE